MSTDLERPVTTLVAPHTGEVIDLAAPTPALAAVVDSIRDLEGRLREVKAEIALEVHRRMDRERRWTIEQDGWKVVGQSDAPVVIYDPDRLAAALTQLVDGGEITADAMDEALEVVTTYKVRKRGVEALRKSAKFRPLIDACGEEKPPEGRRLSVKRIAA